MRLCDADPVKTEEVVTVRDSDADCVRVDESVTVRDGEVDPVDVKLRTGTNEIEKDADLEGVSVELLEYVDVIDWVELEVSEGLRVNV